MIKLSLFLHETAADFVEFPAVCKQTAYLRESRGVLSRGKAQLQISALAVFLRHMGVRPLDLPGLVKLRVIRKTVLHRAAQHCHRVKLPVRFADYQPIDRARLVV